MSSQKTKSPSLSKVAQKETQKSLKMQKFKQAKNQAINNNTKTPQNLDKKLLNSLATLNNQNTLKNDFITDFPCSNGPLTERNNKKNFQIFKERQVSIEPCVRMRQSQESQNTLQQSFCEEKIRKVQNTQYNIQDYRHTCRSCKDMSKIVYTTEQKIYRPTKKKTKDMESIRQSGISNYEIIDLQEGKFDYTQEELQKMNCNLHIILIFRLQEEIIRLNELIEQLKKDNEKKVELDELEKTVKMLQEKGQQLNHELDQKKSFLSQQSSDNQGLREQMNKLQKELEQANQNDKELNELLNEVLEKKDEALEKLKKLQSKYDKLQEDYKNSPATIDRELKEENEVFKVQTKQMEETINNMENFMNAMNSDDLIQKNNIADLNKQIDDLQAELTDAQTRLITANDEKNRLKEAFESLDGFTNLKEQVQKLEAHLRLNSHGGFTDNQKTLIKQVFGLDEETLASQNDPDNAVFKKMQNDLTGALAEQEKINDGLVFQLKRIQQGMTGLPNYIELLRLLHKFYEQLQSLKDRIAITDHFFMLKEKRRCGEMQDRVSAAVKELEKLLENIPQLEGTTRDLSVALGDRKYLNSDTHFTDLNVSAQRKNSTHSNNPKQRRKRKLRGLNTTLNETTSQSPKNNLNKSGSPSAKQLRFNKQMSVKSNFGESNDMTDVFMNQVDDNTSLAAEAVDILMLNDRKGGCTMDDLLQFVHTQSSYIEHEILEEDEDLDNSYLCDTQKEISLEYVDKQNGNDKSLLRDTFI